MPTQPPRCRHLHTDGRQCGSPAVRHEKLCYQHLAATRRPSHTPTLPDPEDLHAVGRGLAELLRLTARELIEDKQAKRLFGILTAAGTNLARLHRQQAQTRELDLRARALTLAENRHAAQNTAQQAQHSAQKTVILSEGKAQVEGPASQPGCPIPTEPGCPTFGAVSPRLRWDRSAAEPPVTDPIDDPVLGLIAPGPDPEPRPDLASLTQTPGAPSFAASPRRVGPTTPQSEQPSRGRQAEIDAELAEQIEFDRRENAWKEENNRIRHDNYTIRYHLMTPEAQLAEDRRRAKLHADHNGFPLPLGPHPRWGITEQPF